MPGPSHLCSLISRDPTIQLPHLAVPWLRPSCHLGWLKCYSSCQDKDKCHLSGSNVPSSPPLDHRALLRGYTLPYPSAASTSSNSSLFLRVVSPSGVGFWSVPTGEWAGMLAVSKRPQFSLQDCSSVLMTCWLASPRVTQRVTPKVAGDLKCSILGLL